MFVRFALLAILPFVVSGEYRSNMSYRTYFDRTYFQSAQSVEVFQVLDLPVTVHEALLVKSERGGYLVKLALGNSADVKLVGLRYSLVTIDSKNQMQLLVNRIEGFALPAYASKTLTFKTPIRFKAKGERLVLMVEQVLSPEWIWEVVKAKDALETYIRGDYSVMPTVMKVINQVDSPEYPRVIYRPQRNEEY
jgi:hypothetical protein